MVPDRWNARGEAEVQGDGRVMLVWQGIPGEKTLARIEHEGQHQVMARWLKSPEPDPRRVEPSCPKYAPCGGCPLMHLSIDGQDAARRSLVRAALDGAGLGDVKIGAFHRSPAGERGFRHVVKLGFGVSDLGHLRVGAWGRNDRRVVPIPECEVAAPVLTRTMSALAHLVIDMNLRPYDPISGDGLLRAAVLRASHTTNEVLVTLVAGRPDRALGELAERLCQMETSIIGVWLHLNDEEGNAIYARDERGVVGVRPLAGKDHLEEVLGGVSYRVGPGDFFQTNPSVAEVLYARVIERCGLEADVPFVDLYCGVGGLALPASKVTGWALGIEEVEGAVHRAREAAVRNGAPAEFVVDRVQDVLEDLTKRLAGRRPVVAVDPARRGLEPGVADGVIALDPRRIAYISCNPAAMARDLAVFRERGFTIGEVELFDMFPNTPHVEALVVLEGPERAARSGTPKRRVVRGPTQG